MMGTTRLEEPGACSEEERAAFARLVRRGFPTTAVDRLEARIDQALCLAFHRAADGRLVGIAALKSPSESYRREVFAKARSSVSHAGYDHELGWVFVVPGQRGNRVASGLCRSLLSRVPASPVFATTRPANVAMTRILLALGFARVGRPYPRGDESLGLFVRPRPAARKPSPRPGRSTGEDGPLPEVTPCGSS